MNTGVSQDYCDASSELSTFPGGSNHPHASEPFLSVGLVCWIMFEMGHGARLEMVEVQSAAVCRSRDGH